MNPEARKYLASAKGGKAGTGKSKARTKAQARAAATEARRVKPTTMKFKMIIRTATALAVASSAWLAGCAKSPSDKPPQQTIQTNPPVGDKVMVSEDGKTFMPLIGGENYFTHQPTYTNYQDAVNRLWQYRQTATPADKPIENPNNKTWHEYAR